MLLDLRGLAFRPVSQLFEIEARDVVPKGVLEGPPQLPLTGNPEIQGLKLEEPAQRRVAPELPVQLQARELLCHPGSESLETIASNPELGDEPLESLAVRLDLRRK